MGRVPGLPALMHEAATTAAELPRTAKISLYADKVPGGGFRSALFGPVSSINVLTQTSPTEEPFEAR